MESIGYFFRRIFSDLIYSLSHQMRYKITNAAESKIRETVEKPFDRSAKNNQPTTDSQDRNTNS
jgi:hypothetical protein